MQREVIVAIDAGHGGRDPGAISSELNVIEKDITFLIASELARTLQNTEGYVPVLIRESDEFIYLDQRYQKSRRSWCRYFYIHSCRCFCFTLSKWSLCLCLGRQSLKYFGKKSFKKG